MCAVLMQWLWLPLLMIMLLPGRVGQTQTPDVPITLKAEASPRIQELDGQITSRGLQLYRIPGLTSGTRLYVHAEVTSGHLDPMVALLRPGARLDAFSTKSLNEQVEALSRDHDPLDVSRQLMDRYALAWNDDYQGKYQAALEMVTPADGDYWLAVGSSLVRSSTGTYRLTVGMDAPEVLSGQVESSGSPFVFTAKDAGTPNRAIALISDELRQEQAVRFYHLADLAAGQTLYAYAEAISGDLRPVLTLFDQSDKPVAYANFTASDDQAQLQYRLPWMAERHRLRISSQDPGGAATAGTFRLLIGLNAPEVLQGKGEPGGG
jgi:hypothetical protein